MFPNAFCFSRLAQFKSVAAIGVIVVAVTSIPKEFCLTHLQRFGWLAIAIVACSCCFSGVAIAVVVVVVNCCLAMHFGSVRSMKTFSQAKKNQTKLNRAKQTVSRQIMYVTFSNQLSRTLHALATCVWVCVCVRVHGGSDFNRLQRP